MPSVTQAKKEEAVDDEFENGEVEVWHKKRMLNALVVGVNGRFAQRISGYGYWR